MLVPAAAAPNTATWRVTLPEAGSYRVYARWTQHANRATDATYIDNHAGGTSTVTVDQTANSGSWQLLGTYAFDAGLAGVSLSDQANGYVVADAIRFDPLDAPAANTASWRPRLTSGRYEVYARWTAHSNRASNGVYTVVHASGATEVPVDQRANGGTWNPLGTFTLDAGNTVSLGDAADGYVIADALRFVPVSVQSTVSTLAYVHADHLGICSGDRREPWLAESCRRVARGIPKTQRRDRPSTSQGLARYDSRAELLCRADIERGLTVLAIATELRGRSRASAA